MGAWIDVLHRIYNLVAEARDVPQHAPNEYAHIVCHTGHAGTGASGRRPLERPDWIGAHRVRVLVWVAREKHQNGAVTMLPKSERGSRTNLRHIHPTKELLAG